MAINGIQPYITDNMELTPKEEVLHRIDRLRKGMAHAGIDFCVILQNVDMFYFTGTIQKGTLVVPVDRDPIFFVEKNLSRAESETPLIVTAVKSDKEIRNILFDKDIIKGTGGMELDVVPVSVFERYKRILNFETFLNVTPLIKTLRQIKSPFELKQVRKSGQIMRHVFAKAKEVIREGVTELDIDAELTAEGRRRHHQGFLRMRGLNLEMMTITVTNGYTGALPSYSDVPVGGLGITPALPLGSSLKKIEKGIPVCVDYGGGYNGYITDETHVFVIDDLSEDFRKPYQVSRQIIEDTEAYGKEGRDTVELFDRAVKIAKNAHLEASFMGFGEGRVSFVGHGIGLEINELPVITAKHHTILREGMVFAFEPKFVLPGKGSIGIEVDFIVTKDRLERVTDIPLDITCL
ncbi:MAG: Xaa-Pro dipeptidase [Syntrophorhabdus sp. PtaU1.Bin050]|nr:MAG: Xaa-Pro dipeptidase [Syntrophorhabdus sp. PtaU1.Bin050]